MKKLYWILIIIGGCISILTFMLIVPVLILDQSWWWFFGTLIGEVFFGLIAGTIILIIKLSKKVPPRIKIDIKSAKAKAVHEQKYDPDNPDNFMIIKSRLLRIGEKGTEKTPILHLEGKGTELNEDRHAIINLNEPKKEISILINPSEDEITEAINKIAEHPPEEEIKEETTRGIDLKTGFPITTTRIRRPSITEKKIEEEKKEGEEASGL